MALKLGQSLIELVCQPLGNGSMPVALAEKLAVELEAESVIWAVGQTQPWFWAGENHHGQWTGTTFWDSLPPEAIARGEMGEIFELTGIDWPELARDSQKLLGKSCQSLMAMGTIFQGQQNGLVMVTYNDSESDESQIKNKQILSGKLKKLKDILGIVNQLLSATESSKNQVLKDSQRNIPFGGTIFSQPNPFEDSQILKIWYEASRQQLEQQKQWNENLINNIITIMSDQTRNPLASIRMGIEILRKAPPSPKKLEQRLDILEQEWHKLNDINVKILQLKELKQEQRQVYLQDFDLILLLKETIEQWQPSTGIAQRIKIHCPAPVYPVKADPRHIQKIFQELLSNAQKFSIPHSTITINLDHWDQTLAQGTNMVKLTFSNQTPAMDERNFKHFFDPFYREQWVIDSAIAGIGLGLTIARTLIEQVNGKIDVAGEPSSQPGQSVIAFTLMIPGAGTA